VLTWLLLSHSQQSCFCFFLPYKTWYNEWKFVCYISNLFSFAEMEMPFAYLLGRAWGRKMITDALMQMYKWCLFPLPISESLLVYNVFHLVRNCSFRMFSNEDVTIGAWMLAMNVKHENNQALCEPDCTQSSIAVWDIPKCSGWC
jgi:hypothetical protein